MAERRMLARSVVQSDSFICLSATAQALYLQISVSADDDGFTNNARMMQRLINASNDDFQSLINGGFLIDFGNGVVAVSHWLINNFIRKDRYNQTIFQKEFGQLGLKDGVYYLRTEDEIQSDSQVNTDCSTDCIPSDNQRYTNGQPVVNQRSTEYSIGKDRVSIDKERVSIDKEREDKERLTQERLGVWGKGNNFQPQNGEFSFDSLTDNLHR